MYYEQHRNLQKAYNDKSYEESGLNNPLYDDKVLDYKLKYEDMCMQLASVEDQLMGLNEEHV